MIYFVMTECRIQDLTAHSASLRIGTSSRFAGNVSVFRGEHLAASYTVLRLGAGSVFAWFMTKLGDLLVGGIVTSGASYVSIPTYVSTSRS